MEARERRHERALASLEQPLRREALRAAFLSACLLADFLLPPELLRFGAPGMASAALLLGALVAVQAWLYRRVWGSAAPR